MLPAGSKPTVIVSFQGWNDVSGAALSAVDHLVTCTDARLWAEIEPEDYYDFQVNQPRIDVVDGERRVVWRTTDLFYADVPGLGPTVLVRGIEPSFRWKAFLGELLEVFLDLEPARIVLAGAVPGEVAHTRPFPVTATSSDAAVRARHGAEAPSYVGPTGIIGVLIDVLGRTQVETLALWVLVPPYATEGPQPKAALALLGGLSQLLDAPLPVGDLEDEARAWERGVDELVAQDGEMVAYVDTLEQAVDLTELPEASGEAIAEEFEKFLRRRDDGTL